MQYRDLFIIILVILSNQLVLGQTFTIIPGEVESVEYHQFVITNVSPIEFYPSDIKVINITIKNIFGYSTFDVSTVVDSNKTNPIKFTRGLQKYLANEIGPNQTFTVQYDISINDDILKGTYYIPVKILWSTVKNGVIKRQEDLNIGILVVENPELVKIDTENITTIPESIKPGDKFKLMVTLKNVGNAKLNRIRAGLGLGMPFSSIGSSTEQYIPLLEPDQNAVISFNLGVDKQAPSRLYNLNFTLQYIDYTSRIQSQKTSFGIEVEETPELYIQEMTLEPTTLNQGSDGLLMVKVANKGTNEVKNVRVTIFGGEKILTQNQNFIGIIKSGTSAAETASFGVHIDPEIEIGDYGLNIQINYDSISGQHHSKSNLYIVRINEKNSIIPISDKILSDIFYALTFMAMGYGIFLIVGFQIDKKK